MSTRLPLNSNNELENLLIKNSQLILSTLNTDGKIHSVPVSYRYRDGEFVIWTFLDRHKVLNLDETPDVTLLINQEEPPKYAMVYGTAKVLNKDDDSFREKLSWVLEKHVSKDDVSMFLNDFLYSEMDFISVICQEIISYDEDQN
jgi:nitroimidazol reductase NimA-like FMN-containing flavoprotein (pyridoxamine 5'-phosphate oxidase superfamily)